MFALLRLTRLEHVPPTSITLCPGAGHNLFATSTTTGLNPWRVLGRKFGTTTSASKSSEGKKNCTVNKRNVQKEVILLL